MSERVTYYINGYIEGESYFKSFGFTSEELYRMKIKHEEITRGNNTFSIDREIDPIL